MSDNHDTSFGFADAPLFRAHGKSILAIPLGMGWTHRKKIATCESEAYASLIALSLNCQFHDLERLRARQALRALLTQLRKSNHD